MRIANEHLIILQKREIDKKLENTSAVFPLNYLTDSTLCTHQNARL